MVAHNCMALAVNSSTLSFKIICTWKSYINSRPQKSFQKENRRLFLHEDSLETSFEETQQELLSANERIINLEEKIEKLEADRLNRCDQITLAEETTQKFTAFLTI